MDPCISSPCTEKCICIITPGAFQCQNGNGEHIDPGDSCIRYDREGEVDNQLDRKIITINILFVILMILYSCSTFDAKDIYL